MTTRSGFMKSSIAAPSFRNSGLEQTKKGDSRLARIAARTRSAVPTGTVDFVMTTFGRVHVPADHPGHLEHVLQVRRAVLARRACRPR